MAQSPSTWKILNYSNIQGVKLNFAWQKHPILYLRVKYHSVLTSYSRAMTFLEIVQTYALVHSHTTQTTLKMIYIYLINLETSWIWDGLKKYLFHRDNLNHERTLEYSIDSGELDVENESRWFSKLIKPIYQEVFSFHQEKAQED
jgi:hypothetical protein